MNTVIKLLERELKLYKRAKEKSIESVGKKEISENTHKKHLLNLFNKIYEYEKALEILK